MLSETTTYDSPTELLPNVDHALRSNQSYLPRHRPTEREPETPLRCGNDGDGLQIELASAIVSIPQSRLRLTGVEELESGITVGIQLEINSIHSTTYIGDYGHWYLGAQSSFTFGDADYYNDSVACYGAACRVDLGDSWPDLIPPLRPETMRSLTPIRDFWDPWLRTADYESNRYGIRYSDNGESETMITSGAFSIGQRTSMAIAWGHVRAEDDAGYADYYHRSTANAHPTLDQEISRRSVGTFVGSGSWGISHSMRGSVDVALGPTPMFANITETIP